VGQNSASRDENGEFWDEHSLGELTVTARLGEFRPAPANSSSKFERRRRVSQEEARLPCLVLLPGHAPMALSDRIRPHTSAPGIACLHFENAEGSKRCRHYLDGGLCALWSEFRCVEWLRKNGQAKLAEELIAQQHAAAQGAHAGSTTTATPTPVPAQKNTLAMQEAAAARSEPSQAPQENTPQAERTLLLHRLSDEDVASFAALGVEVEMGVPGHEPVWLVPEYTARRHERLELSIRDAITITAVVSAFPGATITNMHRRSAGEEPEA
jgi:hypothetical protein